MKKIVRVERIMKWRAARLQSQWISKTQARLIIRVKNQWEKYSKADITMNELLMTPPIVDLIKRKAAYYGSRWANRRISRADFESAFWEEAWKVCGNYTWNTQYHLYETLKLAIKRCAINETRKASTQKREIWHNALPLKVDWPHPADLEKDVTDGILVGEMLRDPSLNDDDRKLFLEIHADSAASLQQLADRCGFSHKMIASRARDRLRAKLGHYNPYESIEEKQERRGLIA